MDEDAGLLTQQTASSSMRRAARTQAGHDLRARCPRSRHAEWAPSEGRVSPNDILIAQGARRIPELLPVRYARMRASPLAFLRGAAAVMAADLATTISSGISLQACGDCHLANFGSFVTPEGVPVFDINDFDETLPAPFEWDLKRLSSSFVLAARAQGMGKRRARRIAGDAARAYVDELLMLEQQTPLVAWSTRIDLNAAIDGISSRKHRHAARDHLRQQIESARRQFGLLGTDTDVPRFKADPPLVIRLPERDQSIRDAFSRYHQTLAPERRLVLDHYTLKDVIFKVVGVGSVGTFCAIGLFATADNEPLLLQIKEATDSVLAPYAGASDFENGGERVVTGQRIMQAASDIFLGWTHEATHDGEAGRQFYVRRMKDARMAQIGAMMEADSLDDYAVLCGRTLARAHARSGDLPMLAGYIGTSHKFAGYIAAFGERYADQAEKDWSNFCAALDAGQMGVPAT